MLRYGMWLVQVHRFLNVFCSYHFATPHEFYLLYHRLKKDSNFQQFPCTKPLDEMNQIDFGNRQFSAILHLL